MTAVELLWFCWLLTSYTACDGLIQVDCRSTIFVRMVENFN